MANLNFAKSAMGVQRVHTILRPADAFWAWYLDRLPPDTTVKPFFGLIPRPAYKSTDIVVGRYCGSDCNIGHEDKERCCQYPDDRTPDYMYGIGPISDGQIKCTAQMYDCYVVVHTKNINKFGYYLPRIILSGIPSPAYFTPKLPLLDFGIDANAMIMATGVLTEFMPADIARVCFEFLVKLVDRRDDDWGNFGVRGDDGDDGDDYGYDVNNGDDGDDGNDGNDGDDGDDYGYGDWEEETERDADREYNRYD
jgi:hypothetical protein